MGSGATSAARVLRGLGAVGVGLLVLAVLPVAAAADDRGTVKAVIASELAVTQQQKALNACLVKSPTRNTPCITRESQKLANVAAREIALVSAALDGSESPCVRTAAGQELASLRLLRAGAIALHANRRHAAKQLFIKSLAISDAEQRTAPACFAQVLVGQP